MNVRFLVTILVALVGLNVSPAFAQDERPTIVVDFEYKMDNKSISYDGPQFVRQDFKPATFVMGLRFNATDKFFLAAKKDIHGGIFKPTFRDSVGVDVVKQYDEYEGREKLMELSAGYYISDSLEVSAGWSWSEHTEEYVTGISKGQKPTTTHKNKKFEGPMIGVAGSVEISANFSLTGEATYYPRLTRSETTQQFYEGITFPEVVEEEQAGSGLNLKPGIEFHTDAKGWDFLTVGAYYEWSSIKSTRPSALGGGQYTPVGETTRGHNVGLKVGIRF